MKLKLTHGELHIVPENIQDEVRLENVLGLKDLSDRALCFREYTIDDRGNVAQFYELASGDIVATLDREAGPQGSVDSVTTWDGDKNVTKWAVDNGYAEEIKNAKKI